MLDIAVITVTLNCEDSIEKTIKSVISQTFENMEFIIIDGGSSDNTCRIISKYQKHLSHFISEPDSGIYAAMNKGIALSKSKALIFLNAGDYFVGDIFFELKVPSLIPVRYKNFYEKDTVAKLRSPYFGMPYCHQGIIFLKNNIRFNESYKISSDYDFFLNHFKEVFKSLTFSKSNGYVFFDNQGVSSKNTTLRDKENFKIIKYHYGHIFAYSALLFFNLKKVIKLFMALK